MRHRLLGVAAAGAVALAGIGAAAPDVRAALANAAATNAASAPTGPATAPTPSLSWSAVLSAPTPVYATPGAGRRERTLPALWPGGYPVRLLILQTSEQGAWLKVLLPFRPNGTTGWISAAPVSEVADPWRIAVSRAQRRMRVYQSGHQVASFTVVVGKPSTPTPAGRFAIQEKQSENPGDFMGSWVMPLAAHSNVLNNFDGGDGQIGIHGRGGASLLDPLGSAASHGCIRMLNADVGWLAARVPPGTPVQVR